MAAMTVYMAQTFPAKSLHGSQWDASLPVPCLMSLRRLLQGVPLIFFSFLSLLMLLQYLESMHSLMIHLIDRTISGASNCGGGGGGGSGSPDTGMNWLMFELLWRDFFR
jgi:hypothetical protein